MAVKINPAELNEYLGKNSIRKSVLSKGMKRAPSFITSAISKGSMSETSYLALCEELGVAYGAFTVPADVPSAPPADVYRLNLVYSDSKVLVQLMHGEKVECGAWAIIRDQSLHGLVQAISYAAHMMYKFSEQNNLEQKELA